MSPARRLREQPDLASFCGLAQSASSPGLKVNCPQNENARTFCVVIIVGFRSTTTISAGQELRSCSARLYARRDSLALRIHVFTLPRQ
jgi:hypothetical protein